MQEVAGKRSGDREIFYNVHKFMKNVSELGIKILILKVHNRVPEAMLVSRRTLFRVSKEGENVETGVTMAFSTPRKLRPKVCTKSILES